MQKPLTQVTGEGKTRPETMQAVQLPAWSYLPACSGPVLCEAQQPPFPSLNMPEKSITIHGMFL